MTVLHGGPPINTVNVATLKLWATGSGRAGKDQMIAAAAERWGVELTNDEADAALVAAWGREEIQTAIARSRADHPTGA